MTDSAKSSDNGTLAETSAVPGDTPRDTPPRELAQTLVHEQPTSDAIGAPDQIETTKQCRDLAFAIAVLHCGYANMRSLALATKSWTTYGSISLADHLMEVDAISETQLATAVRRAQSALANVTDQRIAEKANSGEIDRLSQSDRERHWLTMLDPNGKVAKLLGIADTSVLTNDEIQDRKVGSRYTLLRKLGQGGLGTVWLARDQNLQRYVAVKEISREVNAGDPALDHFRREAEITGRLEHPGIVPVYQFGEDRESGKSFYVMRFLGKKTMQDAIAEYHERREAGNDDPMMLHRLLSALVNVCHSVSHAHSRKVIHRDLKPENIALDEFGQVTLLDWGLAKINDETGMYEVNGRTEPGDLHSVGSSQVGRVLGTPLFMAPEQASGRHDEVDERTDVYALGGILYSILTGIAPHQSVIEESDSASTRSDIMSRIVAGVIAEPQSVNRVVTPELNAVCMKALSSKRYLRYESAADLSEDVQRCMAGTPVTAYTPPLRQRVKRWMANHPTMAQAILLLTSLLFIGGGAIGFTARKGALAVQEARYSAVEDFARELDANLNFEAEGLVRDLRFVSELPLMEAIVVLQNRRGRPEMDSQAASRTADNESRDGLANKLAAHESFDHLKIESIQSLTEVSPDEWLNRQGNVFDGLLRANPAYLVAATCVKDPDGTITELVRSERVASDRRVNRVPKKQLKTCAPVEPDSQEGKMLRMLRPDEVILITNDQLSDSVPVRSRSPLVLSGVRAVFDADGDLFGLNIIELDLRRRLQELCSAVAPEHVSVRVTDTLGNIAIEFHDGRFSPAEDQSIVTEFPELASFFAPDCHADEVGDGKSYFAKRVRLGEKHGKAHVGIVAHIHGAGD